MNYALVAIEKPAERLRQTQGAWPSFLYAAERLQPESAATITIAESVWLIDLANDTGFLANIVAAAQAAGLPHRVFYFQDRPVVYSHPSALS